MLDDATFGKLTRRFMELSRRVAEKQYEMDELGADLESLSVRLDAEERSARPVDTAVDTA